MRHPANPSRNKHKDHWKPFDRKNPPKFMLCGEIGIDDKREPPHSVTADLSLLTSLADVYIEPEQWVIHPE